MADKKKPPPRPATARSSKPDDHDRDDSDDFSASNTPASTSGQRNRARDGKKAKKSKSTEREKKKDGAKKTPEVGQDTVGDKGPNVLHRAEGVLSIQEKYETVTDESAFADARASPIEPHEQDEDDPDLEMEELLGPPADEEVESDHGFDLDDEH